MDDNFTRVALSEPLTATVERILRPLPAELTREALHARVCETRDSMLPINGLDSALTALRNAGAVHETAVGQRRSYRWIAGARTPPVVGDMFPNHSHTGVTMPVPKTNTPPGQTRERVRKLFDADPSLSAGAIAAKLGDVSADAVGYHLVKLRREARAKAGDTAGGFVRAKRAAKAEAAAPNKSTEKPLAIELQRISARFAPIEHLAEKVAVLDQLASGISGKVGALLIEIREDLVRMAA